MALIEEFGDRIELLHVKDVADIGLPTQHQTTVGQGDVDWPACSPPRSGGVKLCHRAGSAGRALLIRGGKLRVRRLSRLVTGCSATRYNGTARPHPGGRFAYGR